VASTDPAREFGEHDLEILDGLAGLAAAVLTALAARPQGRPAAKARPGGDRHALAAALTRLERLPALAESSERLKAILVHDRPPNGEAIAAIESDIGLSVAVLRTANEARTGRTAPIASVPQAVEALGRSGLEVLVAQLPVVDFFSHSAPERFRAHALAVQRAAERLAELVGYPQRDELAVAALLHDVGKLVLATAYPDHVDAFRADAGPPDVRVRTERADLGVDHAMVGGVLMRRWGLPDRLAASVERHHAPDAEGEAAIVRLADMLAHYAHGRPVDPGALLSAARAIGLPPTELRTVLYELPSGGAGMRRGVEPSPLTPKENAALRGLAEGKLYKEIALQLGVTTSTIRSHLHSSYKKLGAADRAQAVLIATERGWL
jgi:putative nucleotidyltransferase with HDIG domain